MNRIDNFDAITEAGSNETLPAGVYPIKITDVIDVPDREYLEVYCDVCQGDYKGYFGRIQASTGKDYSRSVRSYKQTALRFFKGFIVAIEKSNQGYKWDWNEKSLIGKYAVATFGEEEYVGTDGLKHSNVRLQEFRSIEAWKEGKVKTPEPKRLSAEDEAKLAQATAPKADPVASALDAFDDDSLPF